MQAFPSEINYGESGTVAVLFSEYFGFHLPVTMPQLLRIPQSPGVSTVRRSNDAVIRGLVFSHCHIQKRDFATTDMF